MNSETSASSQKMPHMLSLDNRKALSLSGISEVDSFDDRSITAYTDLGKLSINGENLNIKKLNLDAGELEVEGKISSLIYSDATLRNSRNLFSKLFKNNS